MDTKKVESTMKVKVLLSETGKVTEIEIEAKNGSLPTVAEAISQAAAGIGITVNSDMIIAKNGKIASEKTQVADGDIVTTTPKETKSGRI